MVYFCLNDKNGVVFALGMYLKSQKYSLFRQLQPDFALAKCGIFFSFRYTP